MSHYELCEAAVKKRARELNEAVQKRKLNYSACEGLLESYISQPTFYADWRRKLLEIGLAEIKAPHPS